MKKIRTFIGEWFAETTIGTAFSLTVGFIADLLNRKNKKS